jgi:peroxin-12
MSSNSQYSSLISNNAKITIFDVVAQENLLNLFQTAFKHLSKWLIGNYKQLKRFRHHIDELYLVTHTLIEYIYLQANNALFSEYFYGIKRDCKNTKKSRILAIIFSIVVPYVKRKLDDYYENMERKVDLNTVKLTKLKEILLKAYPLFHMCWSSIFWLYRLFYAFNMIDFNSPLLHVLHTRLVPAQTAYQSLASNRSTLNAVFSYSNHVFTALLFFIQFLSWYQLQNSNETEEILLNENLSKTDLNINFLNEVNAKTHFSTCQIVEPPKLNENLLKKFNISSTQCDTCPLCSLNRTNDCAVDVSGFVFCYPCIYKYVNKNKCCPITRLPCDLNNLIRVYSAN